MLSFKQFLIEINLASSGNRSGVTRKHTTQIGPHTVKVKFSEGKSSLGLSKPETHTVASYQIGDSYNRGQVVEPKHQEAILRHVHGVINHYIAKHRPDQFHMGGNDANYAAQQKKTKLYHHLADRIATKHGGEAKHDPWGTTVKLAPRQLSLKLEETDFETWSDHEGPFAHKHDATVAGHKVRVSFTHGQSLNSDKWVSDPKKVHVSYIVNHSMNQSDTHGVPIEHKMAILKHVHNTISSYISQHKPSEVSMSAHDDSREATKHKATMYHSFTQSLAKKHGGHLEVQKDYNDDPNPRYKLHFRHHE